MPGIACFGCVMVPPTSKLFLSDLSKYYAPMVSLLIRCYYTRRYRTINSKLVIRSRCDQPIIEGPFPFSDGPAKHFFIKRDRPLWIVSRKLKMNEFRPVSYTHLR